MSDPFKGTTLMFCDILGDPEPVFAWWPVKCFDGRWAWLTVVWRRLCVRHAYLHGPGGDPWWQYARKSND